MTPPLIACLDRGRLSLGTVDVKRAFSLGCLGCSDLHVAISSGIFQCGKNTAGEGHVVRAAWSLACWDPGASFLFTIGLYCGVVETF